MLAFKTPRERDEWAQLHDKNPRLFSLVEDLTSYVQEMLKKDVVLTSIYRTAEEQTMLYEHEVHKIMDSAHMHWGAVDLRSSVYTEDEIRGLLNYLAAQWPKAYVLYHTIEGSAPHFHVAIS